MSSCCGNELLFDSVVNEIVSSNLEVFSYFTDVVGDYWGYYLGATVIGIVVLGVTRRIGAGF